MEGLGGLERDGGYVEAAPVHVDGRLGVPGEIGRAEREDVLAVLAFSVGGSILLINQREKGLRKRFRPTARRHMPKYNHTPTPNSHSTPSDRNTSPYS